MRALVLAAGFGTRLQPLTLARAKAAAPVDGEPLVRRTIRGLVTQGFTDLVVNLHHRPESITAALGDGADLGARIRYSWESPVLGSAGGPRHALPLVCDGERTNTFLLINGDTLTNVDLPAMIDQHRRSGALVTMALIPNPRPEKYGGVLLDENHAVTAFTRRGSPGSSWHFIGPQVVEASAFEDLEDGVPRESVMEVYPRLMAIRRGAVMGFTGQFSFQDIGTPADLLRTSLEFAAAAGRPDHPKWGHHVRVGASARVTKSELWNDVTVGEHAVLDECVVADGVTIPDGARYERSAIVQTAAGLVVEPLR